MTNISEQLTIAVSKGRILKESIPLLAQLDIITEVDPDETRKLVLLTNKQHIKLIVVRAADVPTYVEYGAADMGIAGKDVLMEYTGNNLYEPLDLKIAKCKMMLATPEHNTGHTGRTRVATKYVNSTRDYFAQKGIQVEIIKLYGSMEIAPLLGLADQIVDLVDTGNTLKANGLVPVEKIADISSHLIVNKASMKIKHHLIRPMLQQLGEIVGS